MKNIYNATTQNGGNNMIIHISGTQGSGKSTIGKKLLKKYENRIIVYDLDELYNEYNNLYDTNKSYQEFLYDKISSDLKPIILVGLDAELCLGIMEDSDLMYDLKANYKYYIETSVDTLKQRFYRQIEKLAERKEWFFKEWVKNQENIQKKLYRFVDINGWQENNKKCDELYKNRGYKFMKSSDIYEEVCDILEKLT